MFLTGTDGILSFMCVHVTTKSCQIQKVYVICKGHTNSTVKHYTCYKHLDTFDAVLNAYKIGLIVIMPQFYIMLGPFEYGLEQYGHLNNNCPFYFMLCFVLYLT